MMVLIFAVVLVAVGITLAAILNHDGYGHRPVPRSHLDPYPTHHPLR